MSINYQLTSCQRWHNYKHTAVNTIIVLNTIELINIKVLTLRTVKLNPIWIFSTISFPFIKSNTYTVVLYNFTIVGDSYLSLKIAMKSQPPLQSEPGTTPTLCHLLDRHFCETILCFWCTMTITRTQHVINPRTSISTVTTRPILMDFPKPFSRTNHIKIIHSLTSNNRMRS